MARASIIGARAARLLEGVWEIGAVSPGRATSPADLEAIHPDWMTIDGPVPVAAALRAAGQWNLERSRDFDADDWWYRCRFTSPGAGLPVRLRFEGLATIADVWLNGHHLLHSENMFVAHTIDVARVLRDDNELVLRFHALGPLLESPAKRPRPRWRTGLVDHQSLRWYRTSLLGRMRTWCPAVAPVGPWRPILIETSPLLVEKAHLTAEIDGDVGVVRLQLRAKWQTDTVHATHPLGVLGTLTVGDFDAPLACEQVSDGELLVTATARVPQPERWWPHTHGEQPLYRVRASIPGDVEQRIDLGNVGFRTIDVDRGPDGHGFGFVVNGVPAFCRGVCWTPLDIARLSAEPSAYRSALEQLRMAGINMVRVAGTMTYEADCFHDLCDELGILLWQDLMFASMDYPWDDDAFATSASLEVAQTLEALQSRPSLVVVCGSSEVDQQAAMLGLAAARRAERSGGAGLPDLVRTLAPGAVWVPTTPTGGTFPFQVDSGVSHYYGVGAYRRPFEDARRAGVRFAAECLAFANVPDKATIDAPGKSEGPQAREVWKAGVPRDAGATWDFADVRDHYLEQLFGVRPGQLRASDPERYLALGRVASGEAMLRTFSEWRRPGSTCRGGLVWFARDLAPGMGWGIIDATGRPKAAYWYLKRALAPVALLAADEGLNGLWFHAVNDTAETIEAELRVALYSEGRMRSQPAFTTLEIPPRGYRSVHADALFDGFLDLTHAYRFGPPGYDVVAASLRHVGTGALLATAHHFPGVLPATPCDDIGLTARVEPAADGYALLLETERFAHAVAIDVEHGVPDDNYLSLEPGETRRVGVRTTASGAIPRGSVSALNGQGLSPIVIAEALHA